MYQTNVNVKVKKWLPPQSSVISMFIENWIEETTREYSWSISSRDAAGRPMALLFSFENSEDAVAIKLKGIPHEFRNYLEIV